MAPSKKGGHISYGISSTIANVLLSRCEDSSLKNIKTTPMWGRSILQRLGFRRQAAATGKVEVPEGARKEHISHIKFHVNLRRVKTCHFS